jgi:hypothetical protein
VYFVAVSRCRGVLLLPDGEAGAGRRRSCVGVQRDAWQDWILPGCASSRDSTYPPGLIYRTRAIAGIGGSCGISHGSARCRGVAVSWVAARRRGRGQTQALVWLGRTPRDAWQGWVLLGCASSQDSRGHSKQHGTFRSSETARDMLVDDPLFTFKTPERQPSLINPTKPLQLATKGGFRTFKFFAPGFRPLGRLTIILLTRY